MVFSKLESVLEHRQRADDYLAQHVSELLDIAQADADADTESPIEAIFVLWWNVLKILDVPRVRELQLQTQFITRECGRTYRLDAAITPLDVDMWSAAHDLGVQYRHVAIELDGHEFHERTKEQVIVRNQRDRDLQTGGWRLLHFSGTELYRDPVAVVNEVANVATNSLNELCTKYHTKRRSRYLSDRGGASRKDAL